MNLVSAEAERICIDRMVKGQEEPFANPEGLAEIDSRMASLVSGTGPATIEPVKFRTLNLSYFVLRKGEQRRIYPRVFAVL